MARLADVVAFLDAELRTPEIPDYTTALNGLQFGDVATDVTHIAAAVDYSTVAIREAAARGANLLLLHHGMFWGGLSRLTEHQFERVALLVRHGIAVYSSHLPLDVHPRYGNNSLLAARLGLTPSGGFARYATIDVGLRGTGDVATETLAAGVRELAAAHHGVVVTTPITPDRRTRSWGMCTGAGASSDTLREAVEYGIDTLIVGEGPHHTAVHARDLGIAVIYGGHYATETLGVEALAQAVAKRFALNASFIDAPTGL